MPTSIAEWIRSVIVYMLVVSVLLHLLPDEKYRQYVRIFAGLLLLLIVIEPVGAWLTNGELSELLSECLQSEAWDTELTALQDAAEEAESSAVFSAYELQLEEALSKLAQAQGYAVRETKVSLTEYGISQIVLLVSVVDSGVGASTAGTEAPETSAAEGQAEKLRACICETYQIEAAAVTVEIVE